jgi:hypothetical protein
VPCQFDGDDPPRFVPAEPRCRKLFYGEHDNALERIVSGVGARPAGFFPWRQQRRNLAVVERHQVGKQPRQRGF